MSIDPRLLLKRLSGQIIIPESTETGEDLWSGRGSSKRAQTVACMARRMQKVVEIEVRYPRLHGRMRAKGGRPHRRQAKKGVDIGKKEVFLGSKAITAGTEVTFRVIAQVS